MKLYLFVTIAFLTISACFSGFAEEPKKMTVCELKKDPAALNHKLIEITGLVSHGFEDFTLFDPQCSDWPDVWLEYGGLAKSGTMYCCGLTADRNRPRELVVEGISISLIEDDTFRKFDMAIHRQVRESAVAHATLVGRFFAGRLESFGKAPPRWQGFGHMGCCSLFAIQQVITVDELARTDLDYDHYATWPYSRERD